MARKPRLFSTVAVQAMLDPDLTGLDWRLYAWVSLHDGMSLVKGSGAGCYASNKTLFAEVGCDYAAGCRSLSKLVKRGHLVREQVGRSTRYRVVFGQPDILPTGNLSGAGQVAGLQGEPAGYVAEHSQQTPEIPGEPTPDYSLRSRELDSEESEELDSIEMARFRARSESVSLSAASLGVNLSANGAEVDRQGCATGETRSGEAGLGSDWSFAGSLPPNWANLPAGAQVAKVEDAFAKIGRDPERIASREREAFATWLSDTAEACWDEPHGQQAQRLYEEINGW